MKSRTGTGIFFTMYSHTTSMLYFSWAEIGMMGAPSATVPVGWKDIIVNRTSGVKRITKVQDADLAYIPTGR